MKLTTSYQVHVVMEALRDALNCNDMQQFNSPDNQTLYDTERAKFEAMYNEGNVAHVQVTGLTLVPSAGTDVLFLETNLPSGVWPFNGRDRATVRLEVAADHSLQYAADNFPGVPLEDLTGTAKKVKT